MSVSPSPANIRDELLREMSHYRPSVSPLGPSSSSESTKNNIQQLSFDVLQKILLHVIPPSSLINLHTITASKRSSPYKQNIRTKKRLQLVCKDWYLASQPLLYEDVLLWDLSHLHLFNRTIDTFPGTQRLLVKRITLSRFTFGVDGAKHARMKLLELCPNVSSLTLLPAWTITPSPMLSLAQLRMPHLTELQLGEHMDFEVEDLAKLSYSIETLQIEFSKPDMTSGKVYWPRLHALVLGSPNTALPGCDWVMPNLQSLTLASCNLSTWDQLYLFIEKHGQRLVYLSITGTDDVWSHMQRILDVTVELKHLALQAPFKGVPVALSHQSVKWIDIWVSCYMECFDKEWSSGLPALQRLRQLDRALLTTRASYRLPEILHPGTVESDCRFVYSGVDIFQEGDYVGRNDLPYVDQFDSEEEEDSEIDEAESEPKSDDSDSDPPWGEDEDYSSDEYATSTYTASGNYDEEYEDDVDG
ncbi:hypothetical protein VNI00_003641 [Paramarasmius palmivorus]|uniref:F-box domain-containing protein n=1 Tax=Paramarasmius palmivorus TaxID=297713 RepID=A0AAW0DVD1_9AGAR